MYLNQKLIIIAPHSPMQSTWLSAWLHSHSRILGGIILVEGIDCSSYCKVWNCNCVCHQKFIYYGSKWISGVTHNQTSVHMLSTFPMSPVFLRSTFPRSRMFCERCALSCWIDSMTLVYNQLIIQQLYMLIYPPLFLILDIQWDVGSVQFNEYPFQID